MTHALSFRATGPGQAARAFDDATLHVWRLPYRAAQGRAPLLRLLAAYLGIPASAVTLREGAHGKPTLDESVHCLREGARLEFNWSHSGDRAWVAIARGVAPGVDIERLGKRPRALDLARRFFDSNETDALAALDDAERQRAFIALWCAKEAVLKAAGVGLSFGLARVAFALHAGLEWRLVRVDSELGEARDWQLHDFHVDDDYRAALAWRGGAREIIAFRPRDEA